MTDEIKSAVDFYERHPITAEIILSKLTAERGHLDDLRPEDLFPHDQDHYGGLAANEALVAALNLQPGMRVADFCAGLGGPARYLARTYGVDVTGIELTPARVKGGNELTRRVGLDSNVRILEGDVTRVPLADAGMDVVLSQEAFLHVPDKPAVLREAFRILKPGGRFAFTDWVAHKPLNPSDADLMWDGMAVTNLQTPDGYQALLEAAGFAVDGRQDLTADWAIILRKRLQMFNTLRGEAIAAGTAAGHDAFYRSYVRFVELVTSAELGGIRIVATKPG